MARRPPPRPPGRPPSKPTNLIDQELPTPRTTAVKPPPPHQVPRGPVRPRPSPPTQPGPIPPKPVSPPQTGPPKPIPPTQPGPIPPKPVAPPQTGPPKPKPPTQPGPIPPKPVTPPQTGLPKPIPPTQPAPSRPSTTSPPTQPTKITGGKPPTHTASIHTLDKISMTSGAQSVEVENLILKFNELLPICKEIREKYEEQLGEENEVLLNTLKEEISTMQQFVVEQTVLLIVIDTLKKFFDTVDKLQEDSMERQKNTLIDYLERLQETLIIAEEIKSKVKGIEEGKAYEDYVSEFIKATDVQVTAIEVQCQERKSIPIRKPGVKKEELLSRIDKLLKIYKEQQTSATTDMFNANMGTVKLPKQQNITLK